LIQNPKGGRANGHPFLWKSQSILKQPHSMGKSYESHQARLAALAALGKDLARRAKSKCELTGAAGVKLLPYEIPPVSLEPDLEKTLLLSEACHAALAHPKTLSGRSWQCLTEMIWSENPAIQVISWRMLHHLAKNEDWAREALDDLFLDPEVEAWAKSALLS
jgi:protein PhnA